MLNALGNFQLGNGNSTSQLAIVTMTNGASLVVAGNMTFQNYAQMSVGTGATVDVQTGNVQLNNQNDSLTVLGTFIDGTGVNGMGQFNFNENGNGAGSLDIGPGGLLDTGAQVTLQGNGPSAILAVTINGTLTTDDNDSGMGGTDDNGDGSQFKNANVALSTGTIDLGTTLGDGMSTLQLQNDTLTVSGNSTINRINVIDDGQTNAGVDDQGTTDVTATLNITTSYAVDDHGTPGAGVFVNSGAVNIIGPTFGKNGEFILAQQAENVSTTGNGAFNVTGGGIFLAAAYDGMSASPIDGLNINLVNGGTLEIGQFGAGGDLIPNALRATGTPSSLVLATDAMGGDTATYTGSTHTVVYNDGMGGTETFNNVTVPVSVVGTGGALTVTDSGGYAFIKV